jgi:hypothetical protein
MSRNQMMKSLNQMESEWQSIHPLKSKQRNRRSILTRMQTGSFYQEMSEIAVNTNKPLSSLRTGERTAAFLLGLVGGA